MSTSTAPTNNSSSVPAAAKKPAVPPEERFWERYSPHHEFPLSTVLSITVYVLVGLLIWLGVKFALFDNAKEPLDYGGEIDFGGGGGNPAGVGNGPGDGQLPENTGPDDDSKLPPIPKLAEQPRDPVDPASVSSIIDPEDKDDAQFVNAANVQVKALGQVRKDVQKDLMAGLGKAGPGSGGGEGTGKGTGKGDGMGPGTGKKLSDRQKRVLRWTMIFDTRNGEDYRVQLQALGAILAIPGDGQYLVIKDLRPPVRPVPEDLKKIQRIFWIDNRPDSVGPLGAALGLPRPPAEVVAFFPEALERELLMKEMAFRGRQENQILETRFRVMRRGPTFEPVVIDQR